ncbi:MAG: LD-carboxypeptidase [Intestinimonas sp.]|jgi:muramoyltetrapeptide carboxypeptidase|nr:LD-carboxypeptidase [Intestinimonas sp.]
MLSPNPLYPGARVALLCASSAIPEGRLEPAVAAIRALGLEPVVFPSCTALHGYFAGDDILRAGDLNRAFTDPSIAGILCARGGYGAHRLLPLLNLPEIAAHPKFFSGYSDVTALHTVFNQDCGFVTYHTVMPATEYYEPVDDYTMSYLRRALFGALTGPLKNPAGQPLQTLVGGRVTAHLCGGNLSLLAASLGTPWEIDTCGKLLFLEDIGEDTYRIDGMLTQLRNAGKFRDCAGVLLGAWTDCPPENPDRALLLPDIFAELIVPAGKPTLAGLACGHTLPTLSLPLGGVVSMDADAQTLEVLT